LRKHWQLILLACPLRAGQNGGVTIEAGGVEAQSRSIFLPKTSGLGELVQRNLEYFRNLFRPNEEGSVFPPYSRLCVFGEWCGPGVQKSVALSRLPNTIFAVFAVQMEDVILYEPDEITAFLTHNGTIKLPDHVYVLPWHTEEFVFDLANSAQVESQLDLVNALTNAIDVEDPWVLKVFGVRGPGEGLVWYPINVDVGTYETETPTQPLKVRAVAEDVYAAFAFKTKGEKHRVIATKLAAQTKPEVAADAIKYVALMLPEPRLQQGVQTVGGLDKKHISAFIKWVVGDVEKEGKDELAASGLQWKQVSPIISTKAREWYLHRINNAK